MIELTNFIIFYHIMSYDMAKGWVTLAIREEVRDKLQKIYQTDLARPANQKFTAYIDELLKKLVDREDRLRTFGVFLRFQEARDNYITVFDNFKKKSVTVRINSKNNTLHCEEDNTTACMHVGFCYAVDEVIHTLISKGIKPPKESS